MNRDSYAGGGLCLESLLASAYSPGCASGSSGVGLMSILLPSPPPQANDPDPMLDQTEDRIMGATTQ